MNFKFLSFGYWVAAIGLFFYSYTQVDLNLTLSQWSIWKLIQTSFQYIGWFNRPLSTGIYLILLVLLILLYFLFLAQAKTNSIKVTQFWKLLVPVSIILLFAYNAFSYDLFNYMFDARIVTLHHLSPYGYKALDFPKDPWVNFMRWTHRTYPYGSVWLWLTIPLSYVGMQFFLPTLFLFKALMAGAYLGSVYIIGKILEKTAPQQKLFGMAFFALNPLVVIESLVSAHNDIVMMFFALLGFYFLLTRRYILAYVGFWLFIQTKFISDPIPDSIQIALPVVMGLIVVALWLLEKKVKEINRDILFIGGGILMTLAVVLASMRTELQPWYYIWPLTFVALVPKRKAILYGAIPLSIGLLLHYVPFLYTGNWDPPIPIIKVWITGVSLVLGMGIFLISKTLKAK